MYVLIFVVRYSRVSDDLSTYTLGFALYYRHQRVNVLHFPIYPGLLLLHRTVIAPVLNEVTLN